MSDRERLNHVLDAIDGALDEDWSVSGDAMRWAPPEGGPKPAYLTPSPMPPPPVITHTRHVPEYRGPSWVMGMRVVEDPAVPRGEAVISVDTEFEDAYLDGAHWRRMAVATTAEARISSLLADDEREEMIGRIAAAYDVPVCIIAQHRWGFDEYLPNVRQYRRKCSREGCDAFETRAEWIAWPERWQ